MCLQYCWQLILLINMRKMSAVYGGLCMCVPQRLGLSSWSIAETFTYVTSKALFFGKTIEFLVHEQHLESHRSTIPI